MKEQEYYQPTLRTFVIPFGFVFVIWFVFWLEVNLGTKFNFLGIYPRTLKGLIGVVMSPFIHSSVEHLYNNSIPMLVLTFFVFYFYKNISWKVVGWGILLSGFLTWLIARPSYHIGASGLIYVMASFLFFKGVFLKNFRFIAVSLIVVFIYGSMLWYIFPIKEGMSWEGHLSGFITGFLLALLIKGKVPEVKKYAWEDENYDESEDEFLKHFDADGNFIEQLPSEEDDSTFINYHYKENKDDN